MDLNVGQQQTSSNNLGNFQVGSSGPTTNVGVVNGFSPRTNDTLGKSTAPGTPNGGVANSGRPDLPPPVDPVSPQETITNFLQLLNQSVLSEFGEETPQESNEDPQAQYSSDFNSALSQYAEKNGLSQNDVNELQFAFYNPGTTSPNTQLSNGSTLGQVLMGLINQAQSAAVSQGINVSTLNPVDNTAFNLNISDSYNTAFENAVNNSNLSADQKATLLFIYYNPSYPLPTNDPNITALLAMMPNFTTEAQQQMSQNFGVPPGYTPQPNNQMYNASLNSSFSVNLQMELNNYASANNLTDDQIAEIKNAIENPNDPSIPPAILAIAKGILSAATTQTEAQNNLLIDWQPSSAQLANVFNNISSSPVITSVVQARELLKSAMNQIKLLMPNGPDKETVMDLLQAVSQAIMKAQNTIYALEEADSQAAQKETSAKLDMQQLEIKDQQAEQQTTAQQSGKQQQMSQVMQILGPIIEAVSIVAAIATGGLLSGVVGAVFAIVNTQFNVVGQLTNAVSSAVSNLVSQIPANGDPNLERLQDALQVILQVVILTVIVVAVSGQLPPSQLLNFAMDTFSQSTILSSFCDMCGIPQQDVVWIGLALTLAVTITVTVVSCVDPANLFSSTPEYVFAAEEVGDDTMNATIEVSGVVNRTVDTVEGAGQIAEGAANPAEDLEEAGDESDEIFQVTQSTAQRILEDTNDTINDVINSVMNQIKNTKAFDKFIELLEKVGEKLGNNPKILSWMQRIFNITQSLLNAAYSGVQGGMAISEAKIDLAVAQYEPEIADLEAMIKNLEKILDSIMNSLSGLTDDLKDLTGVLDNTFSSLESTLSQTTSIQTT